MRSIATVDQKFDDTLQASMLDNFFERTVLRTLKNLQRGSLTIEWRGELMTFGRNSDDCDITAHVRINHPSVFRSVALNGTIGSAEAYMQGGWDTPDLVQVIRVFVANMEVVEGMDSRWNILFKSIASIRWRFCRNIRYFKDWV